MILDIDALETAILVLLADSTLSMLTGGRIASKHQYGGLWPQGAKGIVVRLDDSRPHVYAPLQSARLEMRCYAGSQAAAMDLAKAVFEHTSSLERLAVSTSGGDALVYSFLTDSGMSILYDETVQMDYVVMFYRLTICELAI